ncbi:hypothetical protein HMPREF1487_09132 [Pseudomonas sp. HPB0071]|uniref:DUF3320 domain-containing protein n=1 Tax=unclassified Pseudomonas TaxID=196821 RepID=UPI0002CA52C5|nr:MULTISPECIES: DUF3320 domain-containing protein [unclassified Pseudomonas]ENA27476.1 hypothetical protein HMPREF1487_09132 [Pseudomonas sp. HPB0071]
MDELELPFVDRDAEVLRVSNEPEPIPTIKIQHTIVSKLNLADYQNAIPVIRELKIINETQQRYHELVLSLSSSPEIFKPTTWHIDSLSPNTHQQIVGLDLALDGALLARLVESEKATLTFTLKAAEEEITSIDAVLELLPRMQWGGLSHIPDMTAAFVQPNDLAVERLLRKAADVLRKSGKSPALDGYAGGAKRAWEIASSIWGAMAGMKIVYSLPPASFEQYGQKVRSPSHITDTGLATCFDLALFFCAALEQAGLNPVLVFTQGHAFAGLWLKAEEFSTTLIDDVTALRKRLKLSELVLFETTLITQSSIPPFSYAVERGAAQVAEEEEHTFEMVLDIRRARLQRIKPMASAEAQNINVDVADARHGAELLVEDAPSLPEELEKVEIEDLSKLDPKDRLGRWQRKLLDLSLRNNLLNFKAGKRALKLEAPDPAALEDVLSAGQALKMLPRPDFMDGADPRERALYEQRERQDVRRAHALDGLKRKEVFIGLPGPEMDARLTELYRGARSAMQEGGANTLFLAIGFLSWTPEERAGKKYRAPLVLVPVRLERRSARSGFTLHLHDDEPRFNPTLIEMLLEDFELGLGSLEHELPRDESGLNITLIWKTVANLIKDVAGWEVSEEIYLSTFSFAKFLMWKDLSQHADHLRDSAVVQHLLDTPRDAFASDVAFPDAKRLDADYGPDEVFCPLPSDSSQLAAVMAASKGKNFVLIGPPGTGKSQTIANLIAQSIAQGKRVLFVSEKIAALDVVYRRLREIGLGEFCLEVHSSKASKTDVLAQLQTAWEAKGQTDPALWRAEAERLKALRDSLNLYVDCLHKQYPNGLSIFTAIGIVTSNRDLSPIALAWASPHYHSRVEMLALEDLANRLEVNADAVGYTALREHALLGVNQVDWSPKWQAEFVQVSRGMIPLAQTLQRAVDRFLEITRLPRMTLTLRGLENLAILSSVLLQAAGHDWRFVLRPDIRTLTMRLGEGCELLSQHQALTARLSAPWPPLLLGKTEEALALLLRRRALTAEFGPTWSAEVLEGLSQAIVLLERLAELQRQLTVSYTEAVETLDVHQLLEHWRRAEQSFWPKSFFGMRKIRETLGKAADSHAAVEVAKDLQTWIDIRAVRKQIDDLILCEQVGQGWQGWRSNPAHLFAAIRLQQTIELQKADAVWTDSGFEPIEQGTLGEALRTDLVRLREIAQMTRELESFQDLRIATDGLWSGLANVVDPVKAALSFQRARAAINAQGTLSEDHELVAAGHCGQAMQQDCLLLKQRASVERSLSELDDLRDMVPGLWQGLRTRQETVRQAIAFQAALAGTIARLATQPEELVACKAALGVLLGDGNALLEPQGSVAFAGEALREALEALNQQHGVMRTVGHFSAEVSALNDPTLDCLLERCEGLIRSEPRLRAWCAWQKVRDEAAAVGLLPLVTALEEQQIAPGTTLLALTVNYARWWLNAVVDQEPAIRTFVSVEHEQRIRDFRALDDRFTALTRDWLRARLCSDLPSQESVTRNSDWGILRHEMGKKSRHMPLRELMSKAPDALAKLTPCLLMSPLSIAQYLAPSATPFDIVVFDEASQIPVWDAIGAMARGRQVVMVGDPKQLPPTSFFDRAESSVEDDDVEADLESILDECISANLPTRNLRWHYRSRHESLIAFSNQRYYESKLITFPSPFTADTAVRLCKVDGVYEKGISRTNPIEARAVVDDLVARLKAPGFHESGQTIGVVTFNGEQQRLIEDLLDKARATDPLLEVFFAESQLEPLFVKNLESVQGDERDIIYFSTTYAKDQAGVMSMNFGPLNRQGGERRLNVAVTRARQELLVFSSLRPELIDLTRTQSVGVRDLKHFLEFAERGPRALAEAVSGSVGGFDSPFEQAVAAALNKKGWQVHTQVGVSGFRIDLGVVDPDAPGRYLAGVECDGATYHRSATARDRDKLREQVLRGLGWEILRIWSTDWWIDAQETANRVHSRLTALLEVSRAKRRDQEAKEQAARIAATREADALAASDNIQREEGALSPEAEAEVPKAVEDAVSPALYARAVDLHSQSGRVEQGVCRDKQIYAESNPEVIPGIDPAAFLDAGYDPTLEQLVAYVIAAEGPVLDQTLARRIARAHGWTRTGARIRDRVLEVARRHHRSHEEPAGEFFWPDNMPTNDLVVSRRACPETSGRPVDEICLDELMALARELMADGAIGGEELLCTMAYELGLQKLSAANRLRLSHAIEAVISSSGKKSL